MEVTIMSKHSPSSSKPRKRGEVLIPAANSADTSGRPQPDADSSLDAGLKASAGAAVKKAAPTKPSSPILDRTNESDGTGFILIGVTHTRSKKPAPDS
jgi:hypothetical protein